MCHSLDMKSGPNQSSFYSDQYDSRLSSVSSDLILYWYDSIFVPFSPSSFVFDLISDSHFLLLINFFTMISDQKILFIFFFAIWFQIQTFCSTCFFLYLSFMSLCCFLAVRFWILSFCFRFVPIKNTGLFVMT